MKLIPIRTVDMYWKDFVIHGIDAGWGKEKTKAKLRAAFREEILGQFRMRTGHDDIQSVPNDEASKKIAESIMDQTRKRWASLVRRCNKYRETKDIITMDDLLNMGQEAQA